MILMPVGDHEALYLVHIILQISDIRDHQVYAQHIVRRECQSAVHHNNTVFILKGSNVHTNLLQAAQRDDLQSGCAFALILFFPIQ